MLATEGLWGKEMTDDFNLEVSSVDATVRKLREAIQQIYHDHHVAAEAQAAPYLKMLCEIESCRPLPPVQLENGRWVWPK